ncbi:MAG: Stp1/IreP family PP2C-type Ser/Thr phosphatase [Clostridia bacterium]|nr:Stp1/IreP family PP2C-type Ser/Thr phosphatase [Clostridia bacterium]
MNLYGKTDIGRRRKNNQDSFVIRRFDECDALLGLVCDGMGGASGGNIASALACEVFCERVGKFLCSDKVKNGTATEGDITSALAHAVTDANGEVYRRADKDKTLKGMGTTLVAAVVIGHILYAVNVGDSRLYLWAYGNLTQITKDHSLVQYLLDSGKITAEEAKNYPNRNVITRAVGTERSIEADIFSLDLSILADDEKACALLCSDGLSAYVDQNTIIDILDGMAQEDGDRAAEELISAANEAGGVDNITVVLMTQIRGENAAVMGSAAEPAAEPAAGEDKTDGNL